MLKHEKKTHFIMSATGKKIQLSSSMPGIALNIKARTFVRRV